MAVIDWIFEESLTGDERYLALVLYVYGADEEPLPLTYIKLRELLNLSEPRIRLAADGLIARGLLTVEQRSGLASLWRLPQSPQSFGEKQLLTEKDCADQGKGGNPDQTIKTEAYWVRQAFLDQFPRCIQPHVAILLVFRRALESGYTTEELLGAIPFLPGVVTIASLEIALNESAKKKGHPPNRSQEGYARPQPGSEEGPADRQARAEHQRIERSQDWREDAKPRTAEETARGKEWIQRIKRDLHK